MTEELASLTPALAVSSCGCFLPDLTRFTRLQCGGARRVHCMPSSWQHGTRGQHPPSWIFPLVRAATYRGPRLVHQRIRLLDRDRGLHGGAELPRFFSAPPVLRRHSR